jgi:hypothetical protein
LDLVEPIAVWSFPKNPFKFFNLGFSKAELNELFAGHLS